MACLWTPAISGFPTVSCSTFVFVRLLCADNSSAPLLVNVPRVRLPPHHRLQNDMFHVVAARQCAAAGAGTLECRKALASRLATLKARVPQNPADDVPLDPATKARILAMMVRAHAHADVSNCGLVGIVGEQGWGWQCGPRRLQGMCTFSAQ